MTEIYFFNKDNILQNICSRINFNSYISYLKFEQIDCFDDNNLLYYSERDTQEDIFHFNYNTMPYCICLPLYCLKNLDNNHVPDKIEYIEEMNLPEKCQNNYKTYLNGINEIFKNQSDEVISFLEFNFGLNDINIFSENVKESIEKEYYIIKSYKFPQFPDLTFLIFSFVDNTPLKEILCNLITKIDTIKSYYIIIELSGMILGFVIGNIIIIRNIKKISNVIFDFEKIHEKFLYKLESSSMSVLNKNNDNTIFNSNFNIDPEKLSNTDNLGLIKNVKITEDSNIDNNLFFSNENSLFNELLLLYCKYYNITKEELYEFFK